jgi:hypothetical protein
MAERDQTQPTTLTAEHRRLAGDEPSVTAWRRWGPYVADRSWGTVREDYSADGNAWDFLSHDHARSKAYRWGEDAIAGLCDRYQILTFAPAFWNGVDPILKERLFGLTPHDGNHGEDVKEYYFYLDNLPSHAYMRCLYKYPQAPFPYKLLVEENRRRAGKGPEYELLDTGVFDESRYFDLVIEYAKASEEDIVIRIEAFNRGPDDATIHVIPQIWFRNRWAWDGHEHPTPVIRSQPRPDGLVELIADDTAAKPLPNLGFAYHLGPRHLYGELGEALLFTNNETNGPVVFGADAVSRSRFTKDAFHRAIVNGERSAVNDSATGTKACIHYTRLVPAGGSTTIRLRLTDHEMGDPLADIDQVIATRRAEADEFHAAIQPPKASDDERLVQRQAFAGMLWSKQIYFFDVNQWLDGDNPSWRPPANRPSIRNAHWRHLNSMRILSMPDGWEYPWFAAWDLAFHAVTLALIDPQYAKEQLWLMLFEQFQHPNGQLPAYEWEFSDTNPPVHAWAVWRVYNMDRIRTGRADRTFLERCFHKLLLNFTWWVNKVDRDGSNVFEGGFLGLDNITVLDRSEPLPAGAILEEADATGWMGMYCLNLMRIALELAHENPVYEGLAVKFFEHFVYIGAAMKQMGRGGQPLWHAEDGFFYDLLRQADGRVDSFRVRSLVGLIPLYAVERLERDWIHPFDEFRESFDWFLNNRRDLVEECVATVSHDDHEHDVHVLSIVNQEQMRRLLARIWRPDEFLSPYGMRSLSKMHEREPFVFGDRVVGYEPAEAVSKIKGGNSNWRGPIWFPTTFMMIEALRKLAKAHGSNFDLGQFDADGTPVTFGDISRGLADRLISIFTADNEGRRPVHGRFEIFQSDPHWRDLILFYEFFDGDNGAGLGASHQTGWTGLVASLIDEWRR